MKKGIFSNWFREFATLVLTQSVQAFLLAIVMTIIISALGNVTSESSSYYAAGMLAIIALSQFGKIELLVKNIFGVTSQYGGDMESGKGGFNFAKALALRGASKVLDNGRKVLGGTAKVAGNAVKRGFYSKQIEKLEDAQNAPGGAGANGTEGGMLPSSGGGLNRHDSGTFLTGGNGTTPGLEGGTEGTQQLTDQLGAPRLTAQDIQGAASDAARMPSSISLSTESITGLANAINAAQNRKYEPKTTEEKIEDLKNKRDKAKEEQKIGVKNIASGAVETVADYYGAKAGAILGGVGSLAVGDSALGGAANGAGIGIGVADTLGEKTVNVVYNGVQNRSEMTKDKKAVDNVVNQINQTIQIEQQKASESAVAKARSERPGRSEAEYKKEGEEAAKKEYASMVKEWKNNIAQSRTGNSYDDISKLAASGGKSKEVRKAVAQKKKIDKATQNVAGKNNLRKNGINNISDI